MQVRDKQRQAVPPRRSGQSSRADRPATRHIAEIQLLQRTAGNRAVARLLGGGSSADTVQRLVTTLPVAYVGQDPGALDRLKLYMTTAQVATGGRTFQQEVVRVAKALDKIQPSKATELRDRVKNMRLKKTQAEVFNDAAALAPFVTDLNNLNHTFQLDAAATAVTGREEGDTHHRDYFFQTPADPEEVKFDLDRWSRKGENFLTGGFSGLTIKGIVDEAVKDWDPARGSVVTLLNQRLLGSAAELGGSATTLNVPSVFMNSPVGANYTKILAAAEHIIGVRTDDLTARGVIVEHWKKTAKTTIDESAHSVDWPALLKIARAQIQKDMATDTLANQAETRKKAVSAIWDDATLLKLRDEFGVLEMDKAEGTFKLAVGAKNRGGDVYRAKKDERFGFDINHFTAILFFEWKAVSDLRRQA